MEYTGFIKEYDSTLSNKSIDYFFNSSDLNIDIVDKVVSYLSHGTSIVSWMHMIYDLYSNEIIGEGHGVDTDGVWFWPSYLPYYLRKYPDFLIENKFLDYLIQKNFSIDWNDKSIDIGKMENELFPRLGNVVK
ncbi:hypothetical protein [Taibaiella chishuiensis]|uniref:Uncharacterized protein n=1 Tax=Taibaiella chishuiensis TaxID=1434707 RepID=A0A2P8D7F5_9BACT|nr:hypothetical protein [Taibaiella chishuiensis]PSK93129.1 hypothetical protein B0I18_10298 [Taibaiella chishuiensis]